jgi:hypothetical protein
MGVAIMAHLGIKVDLARHCAEIEELRPLVYVE